MLIDNHLHSENRGGSSPHNFQNLADYIRIGKERGVEIFGFSDHAYIFNEAKEINSNPWQEERRKFNLSDYVENIEKHRKTHPQIMIGMEIDYFPEKEGSIRKFITECRKRFPFDYFIGSVHWIGRWGFDLDKEEYENVMIGEEKEEMMKDYFQTIKKAIESELFDVIGHIDLIKIFSRTNETSGHMDGLADILKKHGQAIEINTNGKNKPIKEFYPGSEFISQCVKKNVPITLGSDAHWPERTGENFQDAISMLRAAGSEEIVYFEKGIQKSLRATA